jgi:uncharacterized membrane protein
MEKSRILLTFAVPTFLFIVVSVPLVFNKIPSNSLYGIRIPKTLSSPDLWFKANHYAGKCFLIAGLCSVVGYFCLFLNKEKLSIDSLNSVAFFLFILPNIVALVKSLFYIKNL